ncbi:hypothetical protein OV079_47605 [Nannocystis pusilla]|uniref:Uncharacterized protein n=1 Tax=Nannocystis pusilla TaxID=889268 RepID=A0A9X3J2V9_9BACT|nr:hypothetical protein [Nannocystis pusilla]MCY1013076.1 hypothetical protein [Nannocystis pusilla]
MRIALTQISPEAGVSFGLSGSVLELVRDQLNALRKNIPHFAKIFGEEDYKIVFIITATRKLDSLSVKGPNILKRHKSAEFSLWIPYKSLDFSDRVAYILPQISSGIIEIFRRYKADEHGIASVVQQAVEIALKRPEKYDQIKQ